MPIYALHALSAVMGFIGDRDDRRRSPHGLALDHRGGAQLREALGSERHVSRIALLVADPHVWFAFFWVLLGLVLAVTIVGLPISLMIFVGTQAADPHRIVRGWLALLDGKPMPVPS